MRAVLLVDYNSKLRVGDEVPADLVKQLVRCGLAKAVAEEPAAETVTVAQDEVNFTARLSIEAVADAVKQQDKAQRKAKARK